MEALSTKPPVGPVIELSYPPSVNHYWRTFRGRVLIRREARAYRSAVCSVLAALRVTPHVGDLAMAIEVFPPDRRRRDIDNVQKAILDACQHGRLFIDDCQIKKLITLMRPPLPGGRVKVCVAAIAPDGSILAEA